MMYGVLYDIEEQLNGRGFTLGKNKEKIEKIHFGLNMCHLHGIITDSEYSRACERLTRMIEKDAVKTRKEIGE